ncbi:MAG: hypothetical protein MUR45_02475, partial [OM182 bacterium]|nr:hypothetical protein [OM182 bacterium]
PLPLQPSHHLLVLAWSRYFSLLNHSSYSPIFLLNWQRLHSPADAITRLRFRLYSFRKNCVHSGI